MSCMVSMEVKYYVSLENCCLKSKYRYSVKTFVCASNRYMCTNMDTESKVQIFFWDTFLALAIFLTLKLLTSLNIILQDIIFSKTKIVMLFGN